MRATIKYLINDLIGGLITYFLVFILGHNDNFWTQNPNKSSKVSKDLDFSLVSHKNLNKILLSGGLGPGPD